MKINKSEIYLFSFLTFFAIFWVLIATPYLENSTWFEELNPVFQYFLFNVGFIMLTIVLINVPYKLVSHKEVKLKDMLKAGLVGWLLFSFIFDLWQPPNYLSPQGQILITDPTALPDTAVDAMLSFVWSSVVPSNDFVFGYSLLYVFVYFVTPVIVVFAMVLLLKPSLVRKAILEP